MNDQNFGYNRPSYDAEKLNRPAIFSLVMSIASLLCCTVWYAGILGSIISIVAGVFGLTNRHPTGKDAAIAGVTIGAVGLILSIITAGFMIFLTRS